MDFDQIFNGNGTVEKILELTERIEKIDKAVDRIRYNNELFTEIPEVIKILGAAREALIAGLKTL